MLHGSVVNQLLPYLFGWSPPEEDIDEEEENYRSIEDSQWCWANFELLRSDEEVDCDGDGGDDVGGDDDVDG